MVGPGRGRLGDPPGPLTAPLAAVAAWAAPLAAANPDLAAPVVVGCSGGADSLALLVVATACGWEPTAVHVDHGLRPDSADDGERVARAATRLGRPTRVVRIALADGPNLEARARHARYAALGQVADDLAASWILTGHTMDDQAETVLLHLLRGAAATGLGGMPARRGRIARPLLGWRHRDTLQVCALVGLDPVVDPMNAEPRFTRVFLRREVVPLLEAAAARDLVPVLARQAELLRADGDHLDACADEALAQLGLRPEARALRALPPPIARRVVRRWLGDPPVRAADVAAVLDVAAGRRRAAELAGGRRVERTAGRLVAVPSAGRVAPPAVVAVRGVVPGRLDGPGVEIDTWIERAPPVTWPDRGWRVVVDADAVGAEVVLRAARPRERIRPLAPGGPSPAADAPDEVASRPRDQGRNLVLARAGDDEIVWVLGYRVADPVRVSAGTRRFLWMEARDH